MDLAIKGREIVSLSGGKVDRYLADIYTPATDRYGNETGFSWEQEFKAGRLGENPDWSPRKRNQSIAVDTNLPEPEGVPAYRQVPSDDWSRGFAHR